MRRKRKPILGNLALAAALIAVNAIRATAILTAAALNAKGNLLLPRRFR